jgi:hypothetical protein
MVPIQVTISAGIRNLEVFPYVSNKQSPRINTSLANLGSKQERAMQVGANPL